MFQLFTSGQGLIHPFMEIFVSRENIVQGNQKFNFAIYKYTIKNHF